MIEIVIGTANQHKVYEMNLIAKPYDVVFLPVVGEFRPIENGKTFEDNALIKAQEARKAQLKAENPLAPESIADKTRFFMADDSGLCVDFLDGAPGIKSARYAETADLRIEKLLEAMKETDNRKAHFECHLVLINGEGTILHTSKGICEGEITKEKRGEGGFGYDPVFLIKDLDLTMAELSEDGKNERSHRGLAMKDMLEWLKNNKYDILN